MEETILVGDDLMMGPPSPLIPPEIASHVLEGVDLCDGILRNLFLCKFFIFVYLVGFTLALVKPIFCHCFISFIILGQNTNTNQ
jgi:hypothetical protein